VTPIEGSFLPPTFLPHQQHVMHEAPNGEWHPQIPSVSLPATALPFDSKLVIDRQRH
jgi:hypothetical protein